ncbi:MAG TPA: DUF4091 domain-containing protein, partial [Chitinophagaceae bacterium]
MARGMNVIVSILCSLTAFQTVSAQQAGRIDSSLLPLPQQHYTTEYNFDKPVHPAEWNRVTSGLHVAFGSTDESYFRTEVPELAAEPREWKTTAWKGERVNCQLVLWSADTVLQVRVIAGDLRSACGKIASSNCQVSKVCYVLSNYPYNADSADCGSGPTSSAYLMPDRFENFDRFDLPGKTARPVWLSFNIPGSASPGRYESLITVQSEKQTITLHLGIEVAALRVKPPEDWDFRLDLWQNPWVIADYFHVRPWSPEHLALLKKHLSLYAGAGGTYITTYGVHSPWGDNEYYLEGGMIDWIRRKDGTWKFDYTIFDKYVKLAMSVGIKKAITIYTPLPWGERFRFKDEATGNYVYEQWLPGTPQFKNNWFALLSSLAKHLDEKKWFDITYLGVNENAMDQTLSAIRVIRQHPRRWKITYAGDWHPELDSLIDDYSSVLPREPTVREIDRRLKDQKTSTFYICCTPARPNTFLFSPPVEARWLGWYAFAHHYSGFLRWAYDSWPEDPRRDGRYIYWPAGDCFLVYPGGNSSIRFEKLREGIVDFEKLKTIRGISGHSSDPETRALYSKVERL